jgi:hypothetical protein
MRIVSFVSTPAAGELFNRISLTMAETGHEQIHVTESSNLIKTFKSHSTEVYNLRPDLLEREKFYNSMSLEDKKKVFSKNYGFTNMDFLTKADVVIGKSPLNKKYTVTLSKHDMQRDCKRS